MAEVVMMRRLVVGGGGGDVEDVVGVMGSVIVVRARGLRRAFVRAIVGMALGGRGRDERGQLVGEVHVGAVLVVAAGAGAAVSRELAERVRDREEGRDEEVVKVVVSRGGLGGGSRGRRGAV